MRIARNSQADYGLFIDTEDANFNAFNKYMDKESRKVSRMSAQINSSESSLETPRGTEDLNNSERVKGVKIPIVQSPSSRDNRTNYGNRNDGMSELNFM